MRRGGVHLKLVIQVCIQFPPHRGDSGGRGIGLEVRAGELFSDHYLFKV